MVTHKIDGVKSAFAFLLDCICASHDWDKDDVKIEVKVKNLKTGDEDHTIWQRPPKES